MIADYVSPERRGRALGVYYVSLAIGSGASLVLGGLIARLIPDAGLTLPVLGSLSQWRLTFLTAGAPGIFLALLLLTVREPIRRDDLGRTQEKSTLKELFRHLGANFSTYSRVLTYPAVIAVIGYGTLGWAPAFFDRRFGMPMTVAGPLVGTIVAAGGLVGTLISGFLSDRWAAKGVQSARFKVTLLAFALILPTVATWSLAPNQWLSLALFSVVVAGFSMAQASAPAVVQEITPNNMRGQMISIYLLLGGLLGIGFGPLAIALVTDHVLHDDKAIHLSLALVGGPFALLGLLLTWTGQKPYARTLAALKAKG
jgi:MFS family permease